MGRAVRRVAGKPLAHPGAPIQERPVSALQVPRQARSRRHRQPAGFLGRGRMRRCAGIAGKAFRSVGPRVRQARRGDREIGRRSQHAGSNSRRQCARGGDAGGPAPARCVDRRSRARSGEPRAGAKTRRVSSASAGRDPARHPAADAGEALARAADRHGGAVSRRAAPRHSGDGLGFIVPALPRRQIAGRAPARIAARRALLVMQYRLQARFHPQRRAHLSSRAVVSSAAGRRAVHARASLHAARQAAGRGGRRMRAKALR